MNCNYCNQNTSIKKGKRNGKQRYHCKACNKNFQNNYSYRAYANSIDSMLIKLLKEGCGMRGIARILEISCGTVLSRMLKLAKRVKPLRFQRSGCKFEVDELFVKIANGRLQNYVTYAIERESRNVIGFVVGGRSKENLAPLINNLLLFMPKKIHTDKLNSYKSLIPCEIHSTVRYRTNRIERKNLTLRTHIKRLARKTICYTKKQAYLEAQLRIYFWS